MLFEENPQNFLDAHVWAEPLICVISNLFAELGFHCPCADQIKACKKRSFCWHRNGLKSPYLIICL